ncbi:MAG: hypothetical protein E6559_14120 [Pantoea sp.]|uniref:hypothetical protein n=1 Tax=Pantoea piersonii TaxID=2364647 RepID=UPI0028AB88C9|nr:hypothetical protein [Pantoea piersonii]MDU6441026.1 hypothetical protein [Pantoea sp.]
MISATGSRAAKIYLGSLREPGKFISATGRPVLSAPFDHLGYCDRHRYPVLIVWKRHRYADVTWLNEPFQCSHGWLWRREDFREDIVSRAMAIYQRYAQEKKSGQAIQADFMTLYDLTISDAEKAACDLFDMTLEIVAEYEGRHTAPR